MATEREFLDKEGFDRLVENIQEGYQPKGDYLTPTSNIEATKLKTPVKLWGQEFDGSKDITEGIQLKYIDSEENKRILGVFEDSNTIEIGEEYANVDFLSSITKVRNLEVQNLRVEGKLTNNLNLGGNDIDDVSFINFFESEEYLIGEDVAHFKEALEGVEKAADDSKVIKGIRLIKRGEDEDEVIVPSTKQYPGYVRMEYSDGISISTNTNYGERTILTFSADTDYLATKNDLSQLKTDILGDDLEETFDTLKAVQDWADEHGTEYAELVKEVGDKADKDKTINMISIGNHSIVSDSYNNVSIEIREPLKFTGLGESSVRLSINEDKLGIYKRKYSFHSNGCLLELNSTKGDGAMITLHIKGGHFRSDTTLPYDTYVYFYNSREVSRIVNFAAINNGYRIPEIKTFFIDNKLYVWFDGLATYDSIQALAVNGALYNTSENIIVDIKDSVVPQEATDITTFKPKNAVIEDDLEEVIFGKDVVDETTLPDLNTFTREDLKKDLFIDMWKKQVGKYGTYNEDTGYFELGTIKDLTYNDALNIWAAGVYHGTTTIVGFYMHGTINLDSNIRARANLPRVGGINGSQVKMDFTFYANSFIEQVIFQFGTVGPSTFYLCERLRQIGLEDSLLYSLNSSNTEESYKNCPKLELIYGALRGGNNINVSWSPLLKLETFKCWLDNCFITSPITITVHEDVYNKLTDEENTEWYAVNQAAIAKQITFATI